MAISRWWADFFRINEQTGESVSNDSCFGCAGIRRRCGGKRVRQGIGWAEKHTEEDLILSATGRYTRLQVCTETLKCFLKMTIGFHILSDGPRKNGLMQRNCKNVKSQTRSIFILGYHIKNITACHGLFYIFYCCLQISSFWPCQKCTHVYV